MSDSAVNLFFHKPAEDNRQRLPVEAIPITIWKCGAKHGEGDKICGANLLTTGGRNHGKGVKYARVTNHEVQCSVCGAVNTLTPVKWSGQAV